MRMKPRVIRSPIKNFLATIAVGGLLGIPALAFGAVNPSPQTPMWDFPALNTSTGQGMTRAQVLSQLRQAKRRGNYVINYATGETAYQADPSAFPAHPSPKPGKTRAQVLKALKKAERTGNYVIDAETGRKANQSEVWG